MPSESPITTSKELIAVLRGLLSAELGTFSDGRSAIWIEPPFSPGRGTGLHCIIKFQPLMITHKAILNNQAAQQYGWDITLTTDATLDGITKLDSAIDKIRKRFPRHRQTVLPTVDGKLPQANFLLLYTNTINCTPLQLY